MADTGSISAQMDPTVIARQKVKISPLPEWVKVCPYRTDFKAKTAGQITYLLLSQQIKAENRQSFFHTAMRLETMEAIQHFSQWRLEFEPSTQLITLHWIKVRRGDLEFEHGHLDRIRFLQRETGLEGLVIDGRFTLLLLLEDVRPGDILDFGYTIDNNPRLLPENCGAFFTLPPAMELGKFQFLLRFRDRQAMKWKSSSKELEPKETENQEEIHWEWVKEDFKGEAVEEFTPSWHVSYPWIQISDCPDWSKVASAFANAWAESSDEQGIAEIAEQIKREEPDILRKATKAIQFVQDEFRYLSVNIELGGQLPTSCGVVARRRFGDCKDVSFLLVHLLKKLGFSARPILVNTALLKSLGEFLPMTGLFNHAIVEYRINGETRWVDATSKRQGGGALNRAVRDYGVGLPVDTAATALITPPSGAMHSCYELTEAILLDTTGANSCLAVTVIARGAEADILRHEFETLGVEEIAKRRLQNCANRFGQATRLGTLNHRDDRDENEFCLAEVFEINGFIFNSERPSRCKLFVPRDIGFNILKIPDKRPRKTPFALPHPCHLIHNIEIISPALGTEKIKHQKVENALVKFNCRIRGWPGRILVTYTLTTEADAVPTEKVEDYRQELEKIHFASMWAIHVPVGHGQPRRRSDFGELPTPVSQRTGTVSLSPPGASPTFSTTTRESSTASLPPNSLKKITEPASDEHLKLSGNLASHSHSRKSKSKPRSSKNKKNLYLTIIIVLVSLVLLFALFAIIS